MELDKAIAARVSDYKFVVVYLNLVRAVKRLYRIYRRAFKPCLSKVFDLDASPSRRSSLWLNITAAVSEMTKLSGMTASDGDWVTDLKQATLYFITSMHLFLDLVASSSAGDTLVSQKLVVSSSGQAASETVDSKSPKFTSTVSAPKMKQSVQSVNSQNATTALPSEYSDLAKRISTFMDTQKRVSGGLGT
jgi:hypothetical protein